MSGVYARVSPFRGGLWPNYRPNCHFFLPEKFAGVRCNWDYNGVDDRGDETRNCIVTLNAGNNKGIKREGAPR